VRIFLLAFVFLQRMRLIDVTQLMRKSAVKALIGSGEANAGAAWWMAS